MIMIPYTGITYKHNFHHAILFEEVYTHENGCTDVA